jgi:hypothetical protein
MIWITWLAARAVGLVTAARGGSFMAALGIGSVAVAVAVLGGWVWLSLHDNRIEREATKVCMQKGLAEALDARLKATMVAIKYKDRRIAAMADAIAKTDEDLNQLEREKKELRDEIARLGGGDVVVFGVDDGWLLQKRAARNAGQAGRR